MILANRSNRSRSRSLRPVMVSLEERVLLNAAMFHPLHDRSVSAQVEVQPNHKSKHKVPPGPTVTLINRVSFGGFEFGSSVLKCEAWDFSLFCRSQSFC
jgi:hypothetical protein